MGPSFRCRPIAGRTYSGWGSTRSARPIGSGGLLRRPDRAGEWHSMLASGVASRRVQRVQRALIALQILLLIFTMVAPVGTIAVEPSPSPTDSAAPSADPSSDPSVQPSVEPSAQPSADPSVAPEPTPAPTDAPPTAAPEPTPSDAPSPSSDAPSPSDVPSQPPITSPSDAPPSAPASTPTATAGQVHTAPYVVTFVAGTSAADQAAALADAGATDVDAIAVLRIHAIEASDAAFLMLRDDPRVSTIELDRSRAAEGTPDDTSYAFQWSLPQISWDQAYGSVSPSDRKSVV